MIQVYTYMYKYDTSVYLYVLWYKCILICIMIQVYTYMYYDTRVYLYVL